MKDNPHSLNNKEICSENWADLYIYVGKEGFYQGKGILPDPFKLEKEIGNQERIFLSEVS